MATYILNDLYGDLYDDLYDDLYSQIVTYIDSELSYTRTPTYVLACLFSICLQRFFLMFA